MTTIFPTKKRHVLVWEPRGITTSFHHETFDASRPREGHHTDQVQP